MKKSCLAILCFVLGALHSADSFKFWETRRQRLAALHRATRELVATSILVSSLFVCVRVAEPVWAVGFDSETGRLRACEQNTNCVSSNYKEPPNRYMSPLLHLKGDRDNAFRRAVQDLVSDPTQGFAATSNIKDAEISPKEHYIHLTVPGTAPGSLDDIELLFGDGGIVNLRCEARVSLPPPPFCVKKNCINGSMDQRTRLEQVVHVIGLPHADQLSMRQEAKWTPIFFNSDRVPDMIEDGFD